MAVIDQRDPSGDTDGPGGEEVVAEAGTMTLWEHLTELRNRILVCVIAVVVTSIAAWFLYGPAIDFMRQPYCTFARLHKNYTFDGGCKLYFTGPVEGFTTRLKVSVYIGVAIAAPVWLFELWMFITPGLKKNEKRYILPFVTAATCLFAMGVTTAILVFPRALRWLILVSGPGIVPLFQPTKYFTLYVFMAVAFGLVFIYPLILVALEITGVVPSAKWRKWRRPAIVVVAAVAAVATPSNDPYSFMALAIPMYVFYEAAIIVGRLMKK